LCIRGFFFKLVVADNIAPIVDTYWKSVALPTANPSDALILVFLFSMQIFADFLGYTDIARGLAYVLGFRLPLNFNFPYIASSFSDFWRRWHISLSSWLRDYLYVPLGGNRVSIPRMYANLMIVMLLGGLWHGAAFTFIIWGGIHGVALAIERALGLPRVKLGAVRVFWWFAVQCVVLAAWTFFRATSPGEAAAIITNMLSTRYTATVQPDILFGLLFAVPVVAIHGRAWLAEQGWLPVAGLTESGAWVAVMCYLTLTAYGHTVSPFIYFQF
jgi:alginate O-acetyltransferase complex protein AlgI